MRWLFARDSSELDPPSARFTDGWRRLRRFWRPSVRADVDDEIAFHMEMRVAEFIAQGLSAREAEAKARAQFGDLGDVSAGLERIGERRRRTVNMRAHLDSIVDDLRGATRALRVHWASSLVALVTLTLGIAASIAGFSVVDAILIRPLPLPHPQQLAVITSEYSQRGMTDVTIAGADVSDIRSATRSLAAVAAVLTSPAAPYSVQDERPEPLAHAFVSTNIFSVLETRIVAGRNFNADDATPLAPRSVSAAPAATASAAGERVAIIGYNYWERHFHSDSSVIGRVIVGPWGPTRVVGVVSPAAQLFLPLSMRKPKQIDVWEAMRVDFSAASRQGGGWSLIARLKRGVLLDSVQARLDSLGAVLATRFPDSHKSNGTVFRIRGMQEMLVSPTRPALTALGGAVVVVLLIACANVGNLLLLRGVAREQELAIRAVIGGTPGRIIRQLLIESVVLATVSTIIGVALAAITLRVALHALPVRLPRADEIAIDGRVLVFAACLIIVSAGLFGTVPALRAIRVRLASALQAGGRTSAIGAAARLRKMIVIVEVALSFVLLIGFGLMAHTFVNLVRIDLGFDPNHLLTFTISNRNFLRADDRLAFVRQVHDRVAGIEGVDGVTLSTGLPFSGEGTTARWGREDLLNDPARELGDADLRAVVPGYFDVMRTRLLQGRGFTEANDSTFHNSVIIDEDAAKRAFGRESPIGKSVVTQILKRPNERFTVVGVVRRERHGALLGDDRPIIYFPWSAGALGYGGWAVRFHGDRAIVSRRIRDAIQSLPIAFASNMRVGGPETQHLIVNEIQPLNAFVDRAMGPTRFVVWVVGALAVIAATLTAIGLYSVVASSVRQRTAEIGVRMAFGAEPRDIFALVLRDGLRLSVAGLCLGALLASLSMRAITNLLAGVRATDPTTYIAMTLVFFAVTLAATFIPARRAASVDPNAALQAEV